MRSRFDKPWTQFRKVSILHWKNDMIFLGKFLISMIEEDKLTKDKESQ